MYSIFKQSSNVKILLDSIHQNDKNIEEIYITNEKYNNIYNDIKKIVNIDNNNVGKIKNLLEENIKTSTEHMEDHAEISSPFSLLDIICKKCEECFQGELKFLDYACGKGNIIISVFINYYNRLSQTHDPEECCKLIIETYLYYSDINPLNVFVTTCCLHELCRFYCGKEIHFNYNFTVCDSFDLDLKKTWGIEEIDCTFVNPPFHDKTKNKTQHKLWVKFTQKTFSDWLKDDGILIQISPSSFGSPSNKVLSLFQKYYVKYLYLDQEEFFPNIGSSFSWYMIEKKENDLDTIINNSMTIKLDNSILWMPGDLSLISLSIHKKVMFDTTDKLDVKYDYVTCHNNILKKSIDNNTFSSISKTKTDIHIYPLFHTNAQIWYSSIKQEFSDKKKVIWTRSGYSKPFYDDGKYGITDLSYYVLVNSDTEGNNLNNILNQRLFKYILKSAKWSGFGTDKVFYALPKLENKKYTDTELYTHFDLTEEEIDYINNYKV